MKHGSLLYIHDLDSGSVDTGAAALSAAALGTTTGAAAFIPLAQSSKMTLRAHVLTSKESYRSLTSAECKALQFPLRQGKLLAFAAAQAIGFHNRQINIFTDYQTLEQLARLAK